MEPTIKQTDKNPPITSTRGLEEYVGGVARAEQHASIMTKWLIYLMELDKGKPDTPASDHVQTLFELARGIQGRITELKRRKIEELREAEREIVKRRQASMRAVVQPKIGRKSVSKPINTNIFATKKPKTNIGN